MFICLAASSLTLILSLFLIYFMICLGSETTKEEGKQESNTGREARPHCLDRQ